MYIKIERPESTINNVHLSSLYSPLAAITPLNIPTAKSTTPRTLNNPPISVAANPPAIRASSLS